MRPSAWLANFGAAVRVLDAYAGCEGDDDPSRPSDALKGYLRQTARDPAIPAVAAVQLRALARVVETGSDDPEIAMKVADLSLPATGRRSPTEWLAVVADLCDEAVDRGFPAPATPVTHWEWNQRFPVLGQLLGCYFNQDFADEFRSHESAVDAWTVTATTRTRAKLIAEIDELLLLGVTGDVLDEGLAELGLVLHR